jgi:3'-phosphoadenosine 5'-phosphosulfate sulfotransferase (PAPS reductase)/FAD synthetase
MALAGHEGEVESDFILNESFPVVTKGDRHMSNIEAKPLFRELSRLTMIQAAAESHDLAIDREIAEMIAADVVIAFGVSGGKDSDAMALATSRLLDDVGHAGPRVLIHADLGEIEHVDSLPQSQRLAARLGLELVIVRRRLGGMIERWEQRWRDNMTRYINLSCVTLITPWSSAGMRFCTSELKVAPITCELATRFHGRPIVNAVGIRREESDGRAKKPISQLNKKLLRAGGQGGRDWYPIIEWDLYRVWEEHERSGFAAHHAYRVNGNTRVSCSVCVLSSLHDLQASLKDVRNHRAYRRVVDLEIASAYSFQPSRWLGDVRPDLLSADHLVGIDQAKEIARHRREVETRIPKELRFVEGWPTFIPSLEQCELLAEVRIAVGALMGLPVRHITADSVRARYEELLALKQQKKRRSKR